jgi:energy-coupling factor transporter ATP-binding protein EcfA2
MRNLKIAVMSYRCFSADTPTSWKFTGDGLTSFVGPNNAGKSTLLRLFYELRNMFSLLGDQGQLGSFGLRDGQGLGFTGVDDAAEIPAFGSTSPVMVEIAIEVTDPTQLCRVRMSMNRSTSAWRARYWLGPDATEVPVTEAFPPQFSVSGGPAIMQITEFSRFMSDLASRVMYIPAYRNLINQGASDYYDVKVGTAFINTWDEWKSGKSPIARRVILGVIDDIRDIFGFSDLSVAASSDNTTLQIEVDGRSERIRELGAGLSQFIMVLGNVAIKRPDMLIIDEPELNLHPALQMKFLSSLAKYANHTVFATHSIGLARRADHVYSVMRENSTSVVKSLPGTRSYAELMGEMSFSAYRELGFDKILCVEGLNDVRAMQCFLRLLKLDQKFVVIPLGGRQFITADRVQELSELLRIAEKVAVLIDSEREIAGAALSQHRQEFVDACEKLGINIHVTVRRAFEHYFADKAIKATKGPSYRALTDYEDFDNCPHAWSKSENWRIAENMTADDLTATDVGKWLVGLGKALP